MNTITPEIETEAAIYAEGTGLSKADILKAYRQHGEEIDIQRFCEQVLKIGGVDREGGRPVNIIRQTGGSVSVGDSYVYDFITRDTNGRLQLWSQECIVNEDGYVEAQDDPRDYTASIDKETLIKWSEDWTLDTRHGDPADCLVPEGSTLVSHRLLREGE